MTYNKKRMSSIGDYFLFRKISNLLKESPFSFLRNRQDSRRNRFYASFAMADNAKRSPLLTRKAKILQIEMIPHNMPLLKFRCALCQFHHQTLPKMNIDRGPNPISRVFSTGTEPKF